MQSMSFVMTRLNGKWQVTFDGEIKRKEATIKVWSVYSRNVQLRLRQLHSVGRALLPRPLPLAVGAGAGGASPLPPASRSAWKSGWVAIKRATPADSLAGSTGAPMVMTRPVWWAVWWRTRLERHQKRPEQCRQPKQVKVWNSRTWANTRSLPVNSLSQLQSWKIEWPGLVGKRMSI